jgi:hypothetical protein
MEKMNIHLIMGGNLKFPVDKKILTNWKSDLFQIDFGNPILKLPNAEGDDWDYTDNQLLQLIEQSTENNCITILIVNVKLQDNYYLRRLNENTCVLSFYETDEIIRYYHFSFESFIIKNIYTSVCAYHAMGNTLLATSYNLAHDETRNCLFDLCPNPWDIKYSLEHPTLCQECQNNLTRKGFKIEDLKLIQSELKKIKKPFFYRILSCIEAHPKWSIFIAFVFSALASAVGSWFYEKVIKLIFH